MLIQVRENRLLQVALLASLCLCMAALPMAVWLGTGGGQGRGGSLLNSFTVGGVLCPYSAIGGWNVGRGWTAVTDVVTCSPGDPPAFWALLRWANGRRTSYCVDFGSGRC